jgi:peptidoglycan/LPS O-acetylase OafA/YrhL
VLRGLSILTVILLHIFIRMKSAGFSVADLLPPWLFYLLFRNGNNGVTVFFAISGFLITFTSLRRFGALAAMRPGRFYRIRFARIAPLLLLILVVLSVLHLLQAEGFHIPPQKSTLARAIVAAVTFHLNWLEAARGYLPPNWDVLWSLSVEEMFYLFFPIVCVVLLRMRHGKLLFIALLLAFVSMGPFARSVWTTNPIWQEKSYLGGMDGIALGCLCALLTDKLVRNPALQGWRKRLVSIELTGAAMMLLIALWPRWSWMGWIGRTGLDGTILAAGTCLVIGPSVLLGTCGGPLTAPIRWFGRHSYEVYMTHEFVVVWGTQLYAKLQIGALAIWVVAIVLLCAPLGAVVAKYFSEPLNRRLRGSPMSLEANAQTIALGGLRS